jgi:hypothetical protein
MHRLLKLETCTLVQLKTSLVLIEFFYFMTDFEYNEDKKMKSLKPKTLNKQNRSAYIV